MKKTIYASLAIAALALTSCNDFLDKLPDDRAELTDETKITSLNIAAYPTKIVAAIGEVSSDNTLDNGKKYTSSILKDELYRFKPVTDDGNDSPADIWEGYYQSVAVANQNIQAIEEMGNPANLLAQRAEALLCRAYSMFQLANIFCMAWNPEKADQYLGLPYPTKPEEDVNTTYTRGTLRQLYQQINKDIEEALPNIDDKIYSVPKYSFNRKAAYAFGARFNLFYMNYDKCIEYANVVLGDKPLSMLRDYKQYEQFGRDDISNRYVSAGDNCNLMLIAAYSIAARINAYASYPRFGHNSAACSYETVWVNGPWGTGSDKDANLLYYTHMMYGSNQCAVFPKMDEFFEYTDKLAGIGYCHIVDCAFTGDETLLCRAEAYCLKKDYQHCVDDLNLWMTNHCADLAEGSDPPFYRPTLTPESINSFIAALDYAPVVPESNRDRSMRKQMAPQGFTVEAGMQENILQLLLHMRRLETMQQGMRFFDIKRYGIKFSHQLAGEDAIIFHAGDLRGAIQLPEDVIAAGLEPNPRDPAQETAPADDITLTPDEEEGEE